MSHINTPGGPGARGRLRRTVTVDLDRGPLLVKAFPAGHSLGARLSAAQRELLEAVVEKDACWGNIGNKYRWLLGAGLPQQRDAIRELLRTHP